MNADVGPELWRVLLFKSPGPLLQRGNPNLAEGDPLPISLNLFIIMKSGKRRLKPAQDPSPRFSGRGAGAATKSLKIMKVRVSIVIYA